MLNSSTAVHNKMFSKILRSPILFFDTNPIGQYIIQSTVQHVYICIGRVLNRFSKDVGFLDDRLTVDMLEYLIVSYSIHYTHINLFSLVLYSIYCYCYNYKCC